MRRLWGVLLVGVVATAVAACVVEPRPRTLPPGFANPRFLLISDQAQGPILVGGDFGMQISLDGGRTWQPTDAGQVPAIAAAAVGEQILVSRGLTSQSYDYALTATAAPAVAWGFSGAVTVLAGNARRDRLWAVTIDDQPGLHYSNDGGVYWWTMPAIGLCPNPRGLAVSAPKAKLVERLWVACGKRGLLASDDLGVSFQAVPGVANVLSVAAARSKAGQIAIATPEVLVSKDRGATWILSGFLAHDVAIDPRNPDLVFAVGLDAKIHASIDGGTSF